MDRQEQKYSKTAPFLATLVERTSLCKPGSQKCTQHITLNIEGSGIEYEVGDCVAVCPDNHPTLVDRTLQCLKATGKEQIHECSLREFLTKKANITEFSKKLLSEIAARQPNAGKKEELETVIKGSREDFKHYLSRHELWRLLERHPEVEWEPQALCQLLMPLLPRFYSIASSQKVTPQEIHLTVALVKYEADGNLRHGVATNYLSHSAPMHEPVVPIYLQHHHGFTIPQQRETPMIMIGPGTGVAPFRAFLHERIARKHHGKNWLFFGECQRAYDFFYEKEWQQFEQDQFLRLTTAFSRDQSHKVYVQHRMQEHAKELYEWLLSGAHLYVCGDAHRMAKDVEATLHQIIETQGKMDETGARAYIKQLRHEKRYLRDVY